MKISVRYVRISFERGVLQNPKKPPNPIPKRPRVLVKILAPTWPKYYRGGVVNNITLVSLLDHHSLAAHSRSMRSFRAVTS